MFLTDETGNVLGNPQLEEGWDGSGISEDVSVTGGHVPYKVVFYNGAIPDCGGMPGWVGMACPHDIPIGAPGGLAPFNGPENVSPRLHSVSMYVE